LSLRSGRRERASMQFDFICCRPANRKTAVGLAIASGSK
jgi:hypothetical protein